MPIHLTAEKRVYVGLGDNTKPVLVYLCNQAYFADLDKITDDPKKVTCKNCMRYIE